jgi:PAS domain S-box-containing protein
VDRAAAGEFERYETHHPAADGSLHFIDFSLKPATDKAGRVLMLIAEGRDITARKKVEEAVRTSEIKFKALFENAGHAIFVTDAKTGDIIDCNSNAEKLVGRPRMEILGMHHAQLHPPADAENNRESFIRRSWLGPAMNVETVVQHKDGRRIPVLISATPLTIEGRKTLIGCFLDISKRKQIEKELVEAKSLAELYLDLRGHDINNLNQIGMGFLELAIDTLDLDERGRGLLLKPLSAFENSSRLIDNVRKLRKVKAGDTTSKDMDIGQVLTDVVDHYLEMQCGASINYIPVIGYVVHANELLSDVFSNLVGNAIKHSTGPPRISIMIEKACENGRNQCKVIVEDHGPGIPDDFKKMIFSRHLRGGKKAKGSGIGLFLVKTLVDDYGGTIWVEDRIPGDRSKGSRFVVVLPAADPA